MTTSTDTPAEAASAPAGRIIHDDKRSMHVCTAHPETRLDQLGRDERGATLFRCAYCGASRWGDL